LRDKPDTDARSFFEGAFHAPPGGGEGLLTGYFEPQVEASFERTAPFASALRPPTDLVELAEPRGGLGIAEDVTWGRPPEDGFEAFPDRGAIMAGALDGQGLELVYLESPSMLSSSTSKARPALP
jgi:membrane-bound lytic murein transglycosylase A